MEALEMTKGVAEVEKEEWKAPELHEITLCETSGGTTPSLNEQTAPDISTRS